MIGILKKIEDKIYVSTKEGKNLPVYPGDLDKFKDLSAESNMGFPVYVYYLEVDEFSHPELFTHEGWGDGLSHAKIVL